MIYRIVFSPQAEAHLVEIHRYVSDRASPPTARRFTDAIVTHCQTLETFPHRGTTRDDIRPGLRTIGFRRRITPAFTVDSATVTILGVFYGGRDIAAILRDDEL